MMEEINIMTFPVYKYSITPFNVDGIIYNLEERPNLWVRFWFWLFFGWRFKSLN